ncbi:MAG TPA: DinB family protein [Candidatus Acidoferrales bacterium]|nr:DinB family protein [Candidatus Acidoferrales bacterium]
MRNMVGTFILVGTLVLAGAVATSRAQDGAQQKAHTPSENVKANWDYVGGKILAMAQDWSEEKYTYRATPEQRTFQQVLLHVAGSNYDLINRAAGKKVGDGHNDPAVSDYKTKAETIAFLKKSIEDGDAEIAREGDAGVVKNLSDWIGYTEHMGEHYGLLVVYYRLNGVVPPDSRPHK